MTERRPSAPQPPAPPENASNHARHFDGPVIGVDVQHRRRCAFAVMNRRLQLADSGWLDGDTPSKIAADLLRRVRTVEQHFDQRAAVGIDAPRMPIPAARAHYWDGTQQRWRNRRPAEKGRGRHCEIVIRALGYANPQWTPIQHQDIPPWMAIGFALFHVLADRPHVYEVFPAASYERWRGRSSPQATIHFADFRDGPRDMLDACVAAVTVHEFLNGPGCEVGGGDGLGTIILPRPVPRPDSESQVFNYPDDAIPQEPDTPSRRNP